MLPNVVRVGAAVMPKSITKRLKNDNNSIDSVCSGAVLTDRLRWLIQKSTRKGNKTVDVLEERCHKFVVEVVSNS